MILLVGIMSFAGVLALSGGINGLDTLGMSQEDDGIDQAMPPTNKDKDIEPDPTIVQQITGGEFVDYLSGPADNDLVIRIDEPIEQAANSDRVIMTYESQSDATHVFADGKKVAEIFCVYPSELQDFVLATLLRLHKRCREVVWQLRSFG